ncbi:MULTISPECIES: glycosyltransferase family 4 protein [Paenibacillus]|uniref:glycosyltransferase family 4 protein n=1 Tax=Paenibacillus TaxID=44249 RepID=UPI00129E62A2|nr:MULTISPECIES: glycosyltransferase family 4 protein [Paenibacillus]MCM3207572.1 glycosyltransferase family 4 protein [Paenibacillus illinoisensis]
MNLKMELTKPVVLLLSWRDILAPRRGGAEVFTHEMLKRSTSERYQYVHFSPEFPGSQPIQEIDGILYVRSGNIWSVILHAAKFYRKHHKQISYVINQCNTHQFFTRLWVPRSKRIFFIHQTTREIWYQNMDIIRGLLGYVLEPMLLRMAKYDQTITVSASTRNDLIRHGFDPDDVKVIPEGIEFDHWPRESWLPKGSRPTFLYVGRFMKYKGIDFVFEAFGKLKTTFPNAVLWIAGKTNHQYVDLELRPIMERYKLRAMEYSETDDLAQLNDHVDVIFHGFVTEERKLELMSRAQVLVFPSQREGWGLTITEAAAVGTPSIVSNSPGLVDAVDYGRSGYLVSHGDVEALSRQMVRSIDKPEEYEFIRQQAYTFAKQFHFDHTGQEFGEWLEHLSRGEKSNET